MAPRQVKTRTCLPRYGVDYAGDLAVTLGGHTCLQWSSPKAVTLSRGKEFIPEVTLRGNKCRNPDKDLEGPWCYVQVSGNVTIDYCDVELCGKHKVQNSIEYSTGVTLHLPLTRLSVFQMIRWTAR